jgi:hypothetical protein
VQRAGEDRAVCGAGPDERGDRGEGGHDAGGRREVAKAIPVGSARGVAR